LTLRGAPVSIAEIVKSGCTARDWSYARLAREISKVLEGDTTISRSAVHAWISRGIIPSSAVLNALPLVFELTPEQRGLVLAAAGLGNLVPAHAPGPAPTGDEAAA
jgi:hypothetical protein